jgi:hypothetical protein
MTNHRTYRAQADDESLGIVRAQLGLAEEEVGRLRQAFAYEAEVVEAQTLDVKSLAKSRREALERSIDRMRALAADDDWPYYGTRFFDGALKRLRSSYEAIAGDRP